MIKVRREKNNFSSFFLKEKTNLPCIYVVGGKNETERNNNTT